jgi:hypothetical protein
MVQIVVFWLVTQCGVAAESQHFGEPSCLHLQSVVRGAGKWTLM